MERNGGFFLKGIIFFWRREGNLLAFPLAPFLGLTQKGFQDLFGPSKEIKIDQHGIIQDYAPDTLGPPGLVQDLCPQEKVKKSKAASHAGEGTPPRRSSLEQNQPMGGISTDLNCFNQEMGS